MDIPETANWECNRVEPWRVAATWALDLPQYNEWMNEEDYEVDVNGKKKVNGVNWFFLTLLQHSRAVCDSAILYVWFEKMN